MSSLHRLIGIVAVWIISMGTLAVFYSVSFLNFTPTWALLLMSVTFLGVALAATFFISRSRITT